jgi:hypothetical protein
LSLNDPDVWIRDTGATTHTTTYINYTANHQNARIEDKMWEFQDHQPKQGRLCESEHEGKKEKCVIRDVTYIPESQYSLFSLTKFISNGWTMSRDKTQSIKMSMGKHKINFDQEVLHPRELYMQLFLSDDKWKKCKN